MNGIGPHDIGDYRSADVHNNLPEFSNYPKAPILFGIDPHPHMKVP